MKINIDISIFIRSGESFGHATGEIELPIVPSVGDTISFSSAQSDTLRKPYSFTGLLKVEDRIFDPSASATATLMLEDLYVDASEQALEIGRYLERAYGIMIHAHK